jgi:hypothetical protein
MNSRWRIVAGAFLIIAIIIVWSVLVTSLAGYVSRWAAAVQAVFYLAAGLVWVLPLKPILRWSETGRWRSDRSRG